MKFSYLAIFLPFDDFLKSSIFSELKCFPFFREVKSNLQKKLTLSQFLNCWTQHKIISKKTIFNGCLQYGIKQ